MVRLLSQQEDFVNQESMLEKNIKTAGHECIFLPKFHCKLNPIEMADIFLSQFFYLILERLDFSIGDGVNTVTENTQNPPLHKLKNMRERYLMSKGSHLMIHQFVMEIY